MTATAAPEKQTFAAETAKLLDIVARSLYTDRDVFVRELVSNASDALEKARVAAGGGELGDGQGIHVATDAAAGTLIIAEAGAGMTRDELVQNLGTIARSGTLEHMQKEGSSLIGRFGVGFYSVFMVVRTLPHGHVRFCVFCLF